MLLFFCIALEAMNLTGKAILEEEAEFQVSPPVLKSLFTAFPSALKFAAVPPVLGEVQIRLNVAEPLLIFFFCLCP